MQHAMFSPFIVVLGAFAVAIVAIIAGAVNKTQAERIRAEQRMAMLARGIPLAEVERALTPQDQAPAQNALVGPANFMRKAGAIRLTAIILIFSGFSLIAFFLTLAAILHQSQVTAGATTGLIPLGVGFGFWVDYRFRTREIARLHDENSSQRF